MLKDHRFYLKESQFSDEEMERLNAPEKLYKYRDFDSKNGKRAITQRELFYANPATFEDPKDTKNLPRYDLLTRDEKIQFGATFLGELEENKHLTVKEIYQKAKKEYPNSPISNNEELKKMQAEELVFWQERTGVLSLIANPFNKTMWDWYSKPGTGICVGFNSKALFNHIGGAGGWVKYVDEPPIVWPRPWDDRDSQSIKRIFYKDRKWQYEEEYRLHKTNDKPLTIEERQKVIPVEYFTEIFLDPEMAEETIEMIFNEMDESLKNVPVFKTYERDGEIIVGEQVN